MKTPVHNKRNSIAPEPKPSPDRYSRPEAVHYHVVGPEDLFGGTEMPCGAILLSMEAAAQGVLRRTALERHPGLTMAIRTIQIKQSYWSEPVLSGDRLTILAKLTSSKKGSYQFHIHVHVNRQGKGMPIQDGTIILRGTLA